MKSIAVNGRMVGAGFPCLLAAEIGINHNGDLSLAHRTIDAAADAGADAVKFQNYHTEDFLSDRSLSYEYVSEGKTVIEPQFDMFKRCELTGTSIQELREHCDRRGVIFFSTPTGEAGIEDLIRAKVPLLKNGSDYLVNLPLIRSMARTGIPTVLSTGMATLAEIDDAVRAFRSAGGGELLLLHCTSSYPTVPQDVHLRKIHALATAFECPVGFSDHSEGIIAAVGGVTLGACMVEKHFTLDKNLPGPDHRFSANPQEFRALVEGVRILESSLGQSALGPTDAEAEGRVAFRLSCVVRHALSAGHRLVEADVVFRRPGTGLPPVAMNWVVGRRLGRDVRAGETLQPSDFA